MHRRISALRREGGFTLPEAVMALSILAIGILMTITPVFAAMNGLRRAKLLTISTNLAQERIEEIRSLPYLEVGFPSSAPSGVLNQTETVTVQGIDFLVTTDIAFVGSSTGLNIVPGGGDGAPNAYNAGIDYKHLTVTVSHPTGAISPVIMDTIAAPPNVGAHEGTANVIVNLVRHNPFAVTDPALNPTTCLSSDSLPDIVSTTTDDQQTFGGVDANQPNVSLPNYWYYIRLSPAPGCDVQGGFPDVWHLLPEDIANQSERVHVGVTQTASATVTIYRPATIRIEAYDENGDEIDADVYLTIDHERGVLYLDENDQSSDGVWTLTLIDGYPIVPGTFTFSITAKDLVPLVVPDVLVPSGFPSNMSHVEVLNLEEYEDDTQEVTFKVEDDDGRPVHGALVTFTNSSLWTYPLTLVTDEKGEVTAYLPEELLDDLSVSSPYGHSLYQVIGWFPTDDSTQLATPSTMGLILFDSAGPTGDFEYRQQGSLDDFSLVLANDNEDASAAVLPDTYDVRKVCDDGSIAATGTVTVTGPGDTGQWGSSQAKCP